MDIQVRIGSSIIASSHTFCFRNNQILSSSSSSSSSSYNSSSSIRKLRTRPICSSRNFKEPKQEGEDDANGGKGEKSSTDWDRAWSSFKKKGKKNIFFSQFSPNKYVSWNPRQSNYPLSEEVDPIKRAERSNLMLWTSPKFTLAGAIVIVTFLLVYTIVAPIK